MRIKHPDFWEIREWWPQVLPDPPLINFYAEDLCYLWYVLAEDGPDLTLEAYEDDAEGEEPEWLRFEMDETGTDIFDMDWRPSEPGKLGTKAWWAIQEGIAPYQPFRIVTEPPRYYTTGYYEVEHDVEYTWWVDRKFQIYAWDTARRWEHFMLERNLHFQMMEDWRKRRDSILHNPMFWWIEWDVYQSDTYSHGWPRGIRASIKTAARIDGRHEFQWLTEGRSPDGDREEAMKDLLKNTKKKFPQVHGNKVRNLPTSQWARKIGATPAFVKSA